MSSFIILHLNIHPSMVIHRFWISIIVIVLGTIIWNQNEFDSEYRRPIIGDGKGYYAYLPAVFIYQDMTYSFVDSMERIYYLEDGSLSKSFRVKQPNGTVVNKCFPGTAIFYLPFFGLAAAASWIAGLPLDGYSILFQWSVVIAHLFYLFCGLLFLASAMKKMGIGLRNRIISLFLLVFGTNIFYYVVYDFSLSHIFGFFGACLLFWLIVSYQQAQQWKYIGWVIPLMGLLLITRPTNAMLLLMLPLVVGWKTSFSLINPMKWLREKRWMYIVFGLMILFLAPLLWKIQSGNWLVYSYENETMDLLNPHFWEFLFSYKKGWWLWSPLMLVAYLLGTIYFWKVEKAKGLTFGLGILAIAYVFSSWWMWEFGMGFGQRPMIEFYPILIIGFAGFIEKWKIKRLLIFTFPLVVLSCIQAYQIQASILLGGRTTKETYWSHFLQLKRDAPQVVVDSSWVEVERSGIFSTEVVDKQSPFSTGLKLHKVKKGSKIVVRCTVGAKTNKSGARIVVSDENGVLYLVKYIHAELYSSPREMSFLFEVDQEIDSTINCYIWNGETDVETTIKKIEAVHYRPKGL